MSPASSPLEGTDGVVTLEIKSNGSAIDETYQVLSVETWSSVNKIPRARIVLSDGDMPTQTWPVSDAATFAPGAEIAIAVGYQSQNSTIFTGIVTAAHIDIDKRDTPTLTVELADKAIKMTVTRSSVMSADQTDSDVLSALIGASGLSADVTATTTSHEAMFQYAASDWDMLLARAEINGMVVITDAGTVRVTKPETSADPVLRVTYGTDLISFRAELDAVSQFDTGAFKAYAWDPKTQALLTGTATDDASEQLGNISASTLAQVLGVATVPYPTGGLVSQDDLVAWASARATRAKLAKIRGRVEFQGSAAVKAGSMIELVGVGARYSGKGYVGGVHHTIRDGNWTTVAGIGLRADWLVDRTDGDAVAPPPAAGHLPPITGLQSGVVRKIEEDPAGEFRAQVSIPVAPDTEGLWARLTSNYASNAAGAYFYPEVGDEVVLGFMNEDPRFPVILGSVHSSKLAPPKSPEAKNQFKAIVTRSKLELSFDDEDKIIIVKTPGGNTVTLSDKDKSISMVDANGNKFEMTSSGVNVETPKDLTLKATGNISIEATGNLTMKATNNASLEGLQVSAKAQTSMTVKGTASAEFSAAGQTVVKGALVQIN